MRRGEPYRQLAAVFEALDGPAIAEVYRSMATVLDVLELLESGALDRLAIAEAGESFAAAIRAALDEGDR